MSGYGGGGNYWKEKYGGGGRGGGGGGGGGGGRGRGAYYKAKYGRGGSHYNDRYDGDGAGYGASQGSHTRYEDDRREERNSSGFGSIDRSRTLSDLENILRRIDGAGYKAYRDIESSFHNQHEGLTLIIDHVQSDPFAPPSRARVLISHDYAGFPKELLSTKTRRVALADYLARKFTSIISLKACGNAPAKQDGAHYMSSKKGGNVNIEKPSQHVLERSSVLITGEGVECRFTVALPAMGRSVLGTEAWYILGTEVMDVVRQSLYYRSLDGNACRWHVLSVEDQSALRDQLSSLGLIGFVRNGAILPRRSGADDRPMHEEDAIPFKSPPSMEVTVRVPNTGEIKGMGIRPGVTVIVGGGFHGKTTILNALELGVYNHVPGDGREFVCVIDDAVKIRAEDGRSVVGVNISPFIDNLPLGKDTVNFSTADASGSTSQAANIIEALEAGAKLLIMDEDTCATNFMIRDQRMQMLVAKEKEPITPFLHKVRSLFEGHGVSSLLVLGGSGDYFEVADCVVMMDAFSPCDVTQRAKTITQQMPSKLPPAGHFGSLTVRIPNPQSVGSGGKITARGLKGISYGDVDIDLSAVEQLVEVGQTRAIGDAIAYAQRTYMGPNRSLKELLLLVERDIEERSFDVLSPRHLGVYSKPRKYELAAAMNRLRTLQVTARRVSHR